MNLHVAKRDYYVVRPTVTPALDGSYEASFDDGATYVQGTSVGADAWAWLVAGPQFPPVADVAYSTIAESIDPLIRIVEAPVDLKEKGPPINVWY